MSADSVDSHIEASTELLQSGRVAEARARLAEALAGGPWPALAEVALAALAGQAACAGGDWAAAADLFRRAADVASAGPGGDADRARVELVRASTLGTHAEHRAAALADLEASLEALSLARDYAAFVQGLLTACRLWLHERRWDTALDRCTRLAETARMLGRRDAYGMARSLAGIALRRLGRWGDAAAALEDGIAGLGWEPGGAPDQVAAADLPAPVRGPLARALLELAWVRGEQGRVGDAARHVAGCVALQVPGLMPEDELDVRLATLLFPATPPGDISELAQALRALAAEAEQRLPAELDAWVEATLALLRIVRPAPGALGATGALQEASRASGRADLEVKALRAEAALRLALGDGEAAVTLLRERLAETAATKLPPWLAAAVRTDLAQALLAEGSVAEATALVELSVRALTAAGLDGQLVQAHRLASEGYRLGGRLEQSNEHLQAAARWVAALEDDATASVVALEQALVAQAAGRLEVALGFSAEATELARASGHDSLLFTVLVHRSNLLLDGRAFAEAAEHLARAAALGEVSVSARTRLQGLRAQARLALDADSAPAHASGLLHEALELARSASLQAEEAELIALIDELSEDRV